MIDKREERKKEKRKERYNIDESRRIYRVSGSENSIFGRTAQNDNVTRSLAREYDIWL